ncbi:hypothetical protein, partial [Vibrio anguillarum]
EIITMYSNTEVRPLTIDDSPTNRAHQMWYSTLNPQERLVIMNKMNPNLSGLDKLNACLNYIQDHVLVDLDGFHLSENLEEISHPESGCLEVLIQRENSKVTRYFIGDTLAISEMYKQAISNGKVIMYRIFGDE